MFEKDNVIRLNGNGLPRKPQPNEKGYRASQPVIGRDGATEGQQTAKLLVSPCRQHNSCVWGGGDIGDHFGQEGEDEIAWQKFLTQLEQTNYCWKSVDGVGELGDFMNYLGGSI